MKSISGSARSSVKTVQWFFLDGLSPYIDVHNEGELQILFKILFEIVFIIIIVYANRKSNVKERLCVEIV